MIKVTAVVPTFNNEDTIRQCLTSLESNKIDEIIVADGGSRDNTLERVSKFNGVRINVAGRGLRPAARAREVGWRAASNDFILFQDADAYIENDAVEQLLLHLTEHSILGAVSCRVSCANTDTLLPNLRDIDFQFAYPEDFKHRGTIDCVSNPLVCGLFRRDALKRVNGFDTSFVYAEDLFLLYKMKRCGYQVLTVYDPMVLHYHRTELRTACMQFYHHGQGRRMLMERTNSRFYASKGQSLRLLTRRLLKENPKIHLFVYPIYRIFTEVAFLIGYLSGSEQLSTNTRHIGPTGYTLPEDPLQRAKVLLHGYRKLELLKALLGDDYEALHGIRSFRILLERFDKNTL